MKTKAAFLFSILLVFCSANSEAASILTYNADSTNGVRFDGPFVIGSRFTVNIDNFFITHLGVQDVDNSTKLPGSNGFSVDIPVGLWTGDGAIKLTEVVVKSTDVLINGYRYVELSNPIALTKGSSYLMGAFVGSGREYFLDKGPNLYTASTSDITLTAAAHTWASELIAPTQGFNTTDPGRWGAANAIFIPEPSAALLGGLGMLLLLRRRRD